MNKIAFTMFNTNTKISVIVAVNDEEILKNNLSKSPLLRDPDVEFIPLTDFKNIGLAFNHGLSLANGEILVFVHQDVYIPCNWRKQLEDSISSISTRWGVIGLVGVTDNNNIVGRSWSNGLQKEVGVKVDVPNPVVSVDELLFVVNARADLSFDENLPGWHLYGTDIVQTALKQGLSAFVVDAPVIHNSLPVIQFDRNFRCCYRYLRKKWLKRLPISTCCTQITYFAIPLLRRHLRQLGKNKNRKVYKRCNKPKQKAIEMGYEVFQLKGE